MESITFPKRGRQLHQVGPDKWVPYEHQPPMPQQSLQQHSYKPLLFQAAHFSHVSQISLIYKHWQEGKKVSRLKSAAE